MTQQYPTPIWKKIIAVIAILFGVITLFKAGGVLFGSQSARDAAGNFVPFVVQFNLVAGGFYILAGLGIYLGRGWDYVVSALISLATIITSIAFAYHAVAGGIYEMQTAGALAIRASFWTIITVILWHSRRRA